MRKNIIILHADQQRFDGIDANGAKILHTPNISNLAREGCNFTRHYSSNPVCSPSRASLLTGLTVTGHGVALNGYPMFDCTNQASIDDFSLSTARERNGGSSIKEKIPTLADILGEKGFDTALFGKLHLQPTKASKEFGYHESCNNWCDGSHDNWGGPLCGFQYVRLCSQHNTINNRLYHGGHYAKFLYEEHREDYDNMQREELRSGKSQNKGDVFISPLPKELTTSHWVADEFISFLESKRDEGKPVFAFLGFPDPHHPFTPCKEYTDEFLNADVAGSVRLNEKQLEAKSGHVREFIERNEELEDDIILAQRYTLAMERNIDDAVGKIVNYLKVNDMYDSTIIVYTSDHGDFLGDFGCLYKHTSPINCLIHTPLIIKPAKDAPIANRFDQNVANYDVLPTLLSMIGEEADCYIQGRNIFEDGYLCSPYIACYNLEPERLAIAVVDGDYKYTLYPNSEEEEFYNIIIDPHELDNLALSHDTEILKIKANMRDKLLLMHAKYDTRRYGAHAIW